MSDTADRRHIRVEALLAIATTLQLEDTSHD